MKGAHDYGADPRSAAHRSTAPQVSQAFHPASPPAAAATTTATSHVEPTFSTTLAPSGIAQENTAAIEGSQQCGRKTNPSPTQEGDVAGPSTDTPALIERRQEQGRQPNPSSTQEGAVAAPSTDTPAVLEENQHQGLASISTTTHNYIGCSVSQYDLSNSSQTSHGNQGHRGCLSQASLSIRIKQLNEVFEETGTLHKAEELLKRHNHIAVCGAPGDGKTSIALKICEKYLQKKYEVLFVDNIEEFQVDTIIQRQCPMLIVFDDIFGSGAFPSNLQKIRKVLTVLADALVNISVQKEEQDKTKREQKKMNTEKKKIETLSDANVKLINKLRFIFTSRTYNWNEGCNRLHQFKINLFSPVTVIDMATTTLTTEERKSIINSFLKRNQMCDVSSEDKTTITQLQDNMFGFPLICQLYCTNPAFQMHKITTFFQRPVTYLRGDLDTIIREGSSRSAALVLLVLCGEKLNLVSFKSGTQYAALYQAVKEEIASCTRTDIGKEISNFIGTYCIVENHVASFSHPCIHDATACALGHLNEVLLLEHCSLQFLYERVRLNKDDGFQSTHIDDVTNMIYITSNVHQLVITRLVQGVRKGCFRWTVGHPIFNNDQIASSFLTQIKSDLPDVVQEKDMSSGECFLFWVSLSTNHSLFEHSVSLMCRETDLSNSVVTYLYDSIVGCIQSGNLLHLQRIAAELKQRDRFDVDYRTMGEKTLLLIAAEAGQLDVFNFLLKEGADVSATDNRHFNCLHHSCKSGSKDIVKVLVKQFQHLINVGDVDGYTPAMLCAKSGQVEILKFLVSHKADITYATKYTRMNAFHIGSVKGHVSVVEYFLTCGNITLDMPGEQERTAVMMAAARGHYDVYNLLVSEGADLSLTDDYNSDCLMLACCGGNMSIVKHLLSLKTFDINRQRKSDNLSPVMLAAARAHCDVYTLLVSEGADLLLTDVHNRDCLMLACYGGNMSIVKHLLSLKTFDINRQERFCLPAAVMMAAARGHYDVYNVLVSEGADLSLTDKDNNDCLMWACYGGNMSIVKHLLSLKTFDINRQGGICLRSVVMMAAARGHYDVYNLLSEGADLSLTDIYNNDCFMLACLGGNMSIVKHLLSLKTFDINRQRKSDKLSPVMLATARRHYDVYNLLVSEGADLSLTDSYNNDCLMLACTGGNMSMVKHLLSFKTFDINRQDRVSLKSAVMMAAASGHCDVYNLLVSEGADLSLTDKDNSDCLMLACYGGNISIVKHLLSLKTFDINRQGGFWLRSVVMMAAASGQCDVYNLLVSEGADLSLTDKYDNDCLMLACEGGNMSMVKHLLSLKTFDINRQGFFLLQSAVMMAAARGHYDVYSLLVSEGADLSLTDKYDNNCVMLACEGGSKSMVKHLLSLKTFDINRQGGLYRRSAVMMAAARGHYDVFNLLVSEGADLSLTDDNNTDCLMLACGRGNMSIVKHLLSLKPLDINRQGGLFLQSSVMIAAEGGHYDVYNLLVSEGADLSLTDKHNTDCLMLACGKGNMSIVEHLLSLKTFDMNRKGGLYRQSAVMMAAARGHCNIYNLLVSEGADLLLTDDNNSDCLMLACEGGNMSIAKHLLSLKTFDINRQGGFYGQSAVMRAAVRGHCDVYNLLVSEGADLSLIDEGNSDCLMLACEGGNMSIVKHLLSLETFDINREGGFCLRSAVMTAAARGHCDVYNLLVSEGADLSLTDKTNSDCLMLACDGGNMLIVKHLLSLKTFDINRQGGYNRQSAVMMAAARGHCDVYNLLVSEGADLSLTAMWSRDCLALACIGGNMSIVKHLLSLKQFGQVQRGLEEYVAIAESYHWHDISNLLKSSSCNKVSPVDPEPEITAVRDRRVNNSATYQVVYNRVTTE